MTKFSLPYAKELTSLRSDTTHGWDQRTKGRAPHKPFLLLSIIDGIYAGRITDNCIRLSQELIESFFTYWNGVMGEEIKRATWAFLSTVSSRRGPVVESQTSLKTHR